MIFFCVYIQIMENEESVLKKKVQRMMRELARIKTKYPQYEQIQLILDDVPKVPDVQPTPEDFNFLLDWHFNVDEEKPEGVLKQRGPQKGAKYKKRKNLLTVEGKQLEKGRNAGFDQLLQQAVAVPEEKDYFKNSVKLMNREGVPVIWAPVGNFIRGQTTFNQRSTEVGISKIIALNSHLRSVLTTGNLPDTHGVNSMIVKIVCGDPYNTRSCETTKSWWENHEFVLSWAKEVDNNKHLSGIFALHTLAAQIGVAFDVRGFFVDYTTRILYTVEDFPMLVNYISLEDWFETLHEGGYKKLLDLFLNPSPGTSSLDFEKKTKEFLNSVRKGKGKKTLFNFFGLMEVLNFAIKEMQREGVVAKLDPSLIFISKGALKKKIRFDEVLKRKGGSNTYELGDVVKFTGWSEAKFVENPNESKILGNFRFSIIDCGYDRDNAVLGMLKLKEILARAFPLENPCETLFKGFVPKRSGVNLNSLHLDLCSPREFEDKMIYLNNYSRGVLPFDWRPVKKDVSEESVDEIHHETVVKNNETHLVDAIVKNSYLGDLPNLQINAEQDFAGPVEYDAEGYWDDDDHVPRASTTSTTTTTTKRVAAREEEDILPVSRNIEEEEQRETPREMLQKQLEAEFPTVSTTDIKNASILGPDGARKQLRQLMEKEQKNREEEAQRNLERDRRKREEEDAKNEVQAAYTDKLRKLRSGAIEENYTKLMNEFPEIDKDTLREISENSYNSFAPRQGQPEPPSHVKIPRETNEDRKKREAYDAREFQEAQEAYEASIVRASEPGYQRAKKELTTIQQAAKLREMFPIDNYAAVVEEKKSFDSRSDFLMDSYFERIARESNNRFDVSLEKIENEIKMLQVRLKEKSQHNLRFLDAQQKTSENLIILMDEFSDLSEDEIKRFNQFDLNKARQNLNIIRLQKEYKDVSVAVLIEALKGAKGDIEVAKERIASRLKQRASIASTTREVGYQVPNTVATGRSDDDKLRAEVRKHERANKRLELKNFARRYNPAFVQIIDDIEINGDNFDEKMKEAEEEIVKYYKKANEEREKRKREIEEEQRNKERALAERLGVPEAFVTSARGSGIPFNNIETILSVRKEKIETAKMDFLDDDEFYKRLDAVNIGEDEWEAKLEEIELEAETKLKERSAGLELKISYLSESHYNEVSELATEHGGAITRGEDGYVTITKPRERKTGFMLMLTETVLRLFVEDEENDDNIRKELKSTLDDLSKDSKAALYAYAYSLSNNEKISRGDKNALLTVGSFGTLLDLINKRAKELLSEQHPQQLFIDWFNEKLDELSESYREDVVESYRHDVADLLAEKGLVTIDGDVVTLNIAEIDDVNEKTIRKIVNAALRQREKDIENWITLTNERNRLVDEFNKIFETILDGEKRTKFVNEVLRDHLGDDAREFKFEKSISGKFYVLRETKLEYGEYDVVDLKKSIELLKVFAKEYREEVKKQKQSSFEVIGENNIVLKGVRDSSDKELKTAVNEFNARFRQLSDVNKEQFVIKLYVTLNNYHDNWNRINPGREQGDGLAFEKLEKDDGSADKILGLSYGRYSLDDLEVALGEVDYAIRKQEEEEEPIVWESDDEEEEPIVWDLDEDE